MSHILTEYSKNLDVKPSNVYVNRHFYPIMPNDYIVIYNEQDIESKNYRYYSLVLDLIKDTLLKLNIKSVTIGSGKDMSNRSDYVYPNLSFRKNAYIVSKAKAFISIDNALTQYASSEGVPVVNLYGNTFPSSTTPYWSSKKNKIDLEPEWDFKPCFSLTDPEDSINKIKAEDVAVSILKLLSKDYGIKGYPKINFKTLARNKNKDFCIDVIPTDYQNLEVLNENIINIRLDHGSFSESAFFQYCMNHKFNLFLKDSIIQPSAMSQFVDNINSFNLILTKPIDEIPERYFSFFKRNNIEFNIFVKNKEILDDVRFQYFDQHVEEYNPPTQKPENVKDDSYFFSFKMVVEGDKIYKSTYHWKNNIDNSDNIVDNADYWEELDYFYIYEQDRT